MLKSWFAIGKGASLPDAPLATRQMFDQFALEHDAERSPRMVVQRPVVIAAEKSVQIDVQDAIARKQIAPDQVIGTAEVANATHGEKTASAVVVA